MELQTCISEYLAYCKDQKRLDSKTLKAYRIDLTQFSKTISVNEIDVIGPTVIEEYISSLHQNYRPKTVKRKIASVKALFHYLEFRDIILLNPFNKVQVRFREPATLPKTIPLDTVEFFLKTIYKITIPPGPITGRRNRCRTSLWQKCSFPPESESLNYAR